MLTLRGESAYSDFRLAKLLPLIQTHCPQVNAVYVNYYYFVDVASRLAPNDYQRLLSILPRAPDQTLIKNTQLLLVIPRLGTVSPWSSKATDILCLCGITSGFRRIERGLAYQIESAQKLTAVELETIKSIIHDRMTETVLYTLADAAALFKCTSAKPFTKINALVKKRLAISLANRELGLALSEDEIDYLLDAYLTLNRDPSDVELMMFAQANSEHCRHKIFKAQWVINGEIQKKSLFDMIRYTYEQHPKKVLSAYHDNAAVIEGSEGRRFFSDPCTQQYTYHSEPIDILIKVETHNHPTAIAPFSGAATGAGGEIRDEGATGRGAKPKAGLCGFTVSHLRLPNFTQPWEECNGKPERMVSARTIMLEGPLGAAAFNNEFGRPNLCGYFRSYEQTFSGHVYGYHKPIMIAGGFGNIRRSLVQKKSLEEGVCIILLGGPALLIGLGGGAASSVAAGSADADLDFASVQRHNPEMQRRCQEVIDRCWALGENNPISSIHDVGAGGLSNAVPEIVHEAHRGASLLLRAIPNGEPSMSPLEIWCNEAQERYVVAVPASQLTVFEKLAARERAPYAVIGHVTQKEYLEIYDEQFNNKPIDIPMSLLFGNSPKMQCDVERFFIDPADFSTDGLLLSESIELVLQHPTVADKKFLITIGDRSITGQVCRDQLVGPWQVAVSDLAVTSSSFEGDRGEAMSMGERSPLAVMNAAASARMAVAEAITNIAAADIEQLSDIKLSANWMAACGSEGEDAKLYEAVKAVGIEFCPALGICIPVGKDSLSMRSTWQEDDREKSVISPVSLIVSAFAPVVNIHRTLTPQIHTAIETTLLFIDLSGGKQRLAGSILSQVYRQYGHETPDCDNAELLKNFFATLQSLKQQQKIRAYHDRSDGGLFTTLVEMAFAGHCGLRLQLPPFVDPHAYLFNEELGAVIQVSVEDRPVVEKALKAASLTYHLIATVLTNDQIEIWQQKKLIFSRPRADLQALWSKVSYHLQAERDNPACALEEYENIHRPDKGLFSKLTFDLNNTSFPRLKKNTRPRVAILREQGVNGQLEMAAAFDRAGFESIDVHMNDFFQNTVDLSEFQGLVACGGFSYGDVLGAGTGWANSILFNARVHDQFAAFFNRTDTFTLGVCNGCQMLSQLHSLIPGAEHWPRFHRNLSEQFEARVCMVEVQDSPSVFFTGMQGSQFPIAVAHGEGRAVSQTSGRAPVALRYIDHEGLVTERYPYNPNGSLEGVTAVTSIDGRATIMMPHPERVYRTVTNSWHPSEWPEEAPTMRMFRNARHWIG